jgi:hypothetical protein
MRECGDCNLCCKILKVPDVRGQEKPSCTWCPLAVKGGGCSDYENRPMECREWECLWLSSGSESKPETEAIKQCFTEAEEAKKQGRPDMPIMPRDILRWVRSIDNRLVRLSALPDDLKPNRIKAVIENCLDFIDIRCEFHGGFDMTNAKVWGWTIKQESNGMPVILSMEDSHATTPMGPISELLMRGYARTHSEWTKPAFIDHIGKALDVREWFLNTTLEQRATACIQYAIKRGVSHASLLKVFERMLVP